MTRALLNKSKEAASAINILGGVIELLEGGTTAGWDATASKIIDLCKREQQQQLKIMDAADEKLGFPYPRAGGRKPEGRA